MVLLWIQTLHSAKLEKTIDTLVLSGESISGKVDDLGSSLSKNLIGKEKIAELDNRPYLRLETEKVLFHRDSLYFGFPIKNYGDGIASKITLAFYSEQLLYGGDGLQTTIEDIPPQQTRLFRVPATLPASERTGIPKRYRELFTEVFEGDGSLIFEVKLKYEWNDKHYETPWRIGILQKHGVRLFLTSKNDMHIDRSK